MNVSMTRREKQILELIVEGGCNKSIAKNLDISVSTVKFHCSNLFDKHKVNNRRQLIIRSVQQIAARPFSFS